MNLIVIYGPPGVGKLTVAKELSRLTGYRVMHNHLTIQVGLAIFDFGSPQLIRLLDKLRLVIFEEAASADVDVISTTAFVSSDTIDPDNESFFQKVEALGIRICLVQLLCAQAAQEERLQSPERAQLGKLTSVVALREWMEGKDITRVIPGRDSLSIDNTELPPDEVARQIAAHYGLMTVL